MSKRRIASSSYDAASSVSHGSKASFSSRSEKGAPSPLKPERAPPRQRSEPDLRKVKPAVRAAPYPDCRRVWDLDDWNVEEDPDGREVPMIKTIGRQLIFMNTADAFNKGNSSQTSRKMSEHGMLSSRSASSTRSAVSTRSGMGSQRSQSAGSLRSSASRSVYSARSARSVSSFGGCSAAPFDGFAAAEETYRNPGRDQIFINDPSLRLQQVHGYKRSAFGGGFTWSARQSPESQCSFQNAEPAPKYGFQPSTCEKPLKENCSRCNPDRAGPGFSRTPYGGFYARHRSDY
eukprot:gnl/MRDRNA2_/MRDRNA2_92661_c0_seq1.p1 gnl/MRDRNA2_/MRDRNA2_92661_c0~~gnl/MRDRNA2_/MRDRNA2_92661_c0_seq1.p1  ORF type:complete len:290 (-),score=47.83 gnl/MRDRNA2_/MRDRNA2_92661_c0_seq1:245-1114(-)